MKPLLGTKTVLYFIFTSLVCSVSAQHGSNEDGDGIPLPFRIVLLIFLTVLSAVVAGLTLALMALDLTNLSVLEIAGTEEEKRLVARVIPVRKNGHVLLTTLLLTSTAVNETLPILFDGMFKKGFISIITSTVIIVVLAEIIPQAVFKKHGLKTGATFAWLVKLLICIWIPIAWPLSKLLDIICKSSSGTAYKLTELKALIQLHDKSAQKNGPLNRETAEIVQNTLSMQGKKVDEVMTLPGHLILPSSTQLTKSFVSNCMTDGNHTLLVSDESAEKQVIIGALDVKMLDMLDADALKVTLDQLPLKPCIKMPVSSKVIEAAYLLMKADQESVIVLTEEQEPTNTIQFTSSSSTLVSEPSSKLFPRQKSSASLCSSVSEKADHNNTATSCYPLSTTQTVFTERIVGFITLSDVLQQLVHVRSFEPQETPRNTGDYTAFGPFMRKLLLS